MDLEPADDLDTISRIEYLQRHRTIGLGGSYSRPNCTLLYDSFEFIMSYSPVHD